MPGGFADDYAPRHPLPRRRRGCRRGPAPSPSPTTARNPVRDAGRSPKKYARLAQNFRSQRLASTWAEGDLPQASNKAWGLVAETVKAVSAQHGCIIHAHRTIQMVVRELERVAGNAGDTATRQWINNSFFVARGLHSNFYEDEADLEDVREGLRACASMLAEQPAGPVRHALAAAPDAG